MNDEMIILTANCLYFLLKKTHYLVFSVFSFSFHPSFPLCPHRSQDIFREAMRSPLVRLEVVSSSNRERYEKSLIGQLLVNSSAPNSSPHQVIKTKQPPPPVKAKPVFKPPENLTARVGEEPPVLEAVNVSLFLFI